MNEILKTIYHRRSIRKYNSAKVDRTLIEELLDAGRMAPSAMNAQPWRFYVVNDSSLISEMDRQVREVTKEMYDGQGLSLLLKQENAVFHGAPVVIFIAASKRNEWAGLDIGMCAQNIMLAAKVLGLDSCPVGFGKLIEKTSLYKYLGVPDDETVILSLVIGYGAEQPEVHDRKKDNVVYIKAPASVPV